MQTPSIHGNSDQQTNTTGTAAMSPNEMSFSERMAHWDSLRQEFDLANMYVSTVARCFADAMLVNPNDPIIPSFIQAYRNALEARNSALIAFQSFKI